MNPVELQRKLLAVARANPPSDRVPFAFERRIMARLAAEPAQDIWALWAHALWRAAAPCVLIMVALTAWSFLTTEANAPGTDLSQDFDNTVLASVAQDQPLDLSR